jgi:hypothetical protein
VTPLEAMARADVLDRYGQDIFLNFAEEDKRVCIERMKKCLRALDGCELPEEARRRAKPYRGGEDVGEASFHAIVRQILEDGR